MNKLNIKRFAGLPFTWTSHTIRNIKRDVLGGNIVQAEVYLVLHTMGSSIDTIYEIDSNGDTSWATSSWTIETEDANKDTAIHKIFSNGEDLKGIRINNYSDNLTAELTFNFDLVANSNQTKYLTKIGQTAWLSGNVINDISTYDYNNAPSIAAVRNYLDSGGIVRGDGINKIVYMDDFSQYQQLQTEYRIDNNTEYHIAETESSYSSLESYIQEIILRAHPIGSIELNITGDNPSTYLGGTWIQVSQGRAIFGEGTCSTTYNVRGTSKTFSNTYTADTNYAAGLPNITGTGHYADNNNAFAGALYNAGNANYIGDGSASGTLIALDASRDRAIYGKSNTVQPNAYVVYVWKRTA
jgi:hypothetical protein